MLKNFLINVRGLFGLFLMSVNSVLCIVPLMFVVFLKLLIPFAAWRKFCSRILNLFADIWCSINNFFIFAFSSISIQSNPLAHASRDNSYLVVCNHQSWLDIVILQRVLTWKIPMLKFFIKEELKWVPLLGLAWWALDFPFLKRYSKQQISDNPGLREKDLATARAACERIKVLPFSIMIFPEGTRFTPKKKVRQNSPFESLLRPKSGGIAYVLNLLGDRMNYIYNVTIHYPEGRPHLWDFMCGKIKAIQVNVDAIPVTSEWIGDYYYDLTFQKKFNEKINQLWCEKQALLDKLDEKN